MRSPTTGAASRTSATTATAPKATGRRHSRSPQAANRGERCSPTCTQGSEPQLTLSSSADSTTGSRVRVAASTKTTASMMPPAIERNDGDGTSMTAESDTRTVRPESSTALPAVSMVSAIASAGSSWEPSRAARKRCTMNSA